MLRWVPAFAIEALTAILLVLFEPALAFSNAGRMIVLGFLVALARSPFWVSSFFSYGKAARI